MTHLVKRIFQLVSYNTFLLFFLLIVLNIGSWAILESYARWFSDHPVIEKYGFEKLRSVYPTLSDSEIRSLLFETWSRTYQYAPFTQFKEQPFKGTWVNINENGYRVHSSSASTEKSTSVDSLYTIAVLGGSTTFGYGVADNETIPFYLEKHLTSRLWVNQRVRNLGQGHYYSSQERVLALHELLKDSSINHLVFLDGLNEFYYEEDAPLFTSRIRNSLESEHLLLPWILSWPLVELSVKVERNLFPSKDDVPEFSRSKLKSIISRYFANVNQIANIASSYNVSTTFCIQPIPVYKYNLQYHPFAYHDFGRHKNAHQGYHLLDSLIEVKGQKLPIIWLGDMQKDDTTANYVDQVHYSAPFSNRIADTLATILIRKISPSLQQRP